MAGRPSKPTKLKILAGNPGRRKLPRNEPRPPPGIPSCPAWLSLEGKREWKRIVPELDGLRLLTLIDRAALAAYCQAWAELSLATQKLNKEGRIISEAVFNKAGDETGSIEKTHPAVKQQRDAFTRVKQFLVEFGLSPASRAKVGGGGPGAGDVDPLEELMRRGQKQKKQA